MFASSSRRRLLGLLAVTATFVPVSSAPALAAGAKVCVGGPSSLLLSPGSDGQCDRRGYTLTTLASESDLTALRSRVNSLESDNATLKSDVSAVQAKVAALESANTSLQAKVSTLEDKLSKVSYDATGVNGKPTLKITGANLQLLDGTGDTEGTVNGLGNLFIGYNEQDGDTQTGSHNLIIGPYHSFTAFGGLLAGLDNNVTGEYASVSGGERNMASGHSASVSGGVANLASGRHASVSGGGANTAEGVLASVSGGAQSRASGTASSVLGGYQSAVYTMYGTGP